VDGTDHAFHIANNHGESSSILALKHHKDVWPDVGYDRTVMMQSTTLPSLLARHGIDGRRYQALVLDTQGSELLVLRGAASLLPCFRFVKAEAADFEAYEGCCRIADLTAFLGGHGFRERSRRRFATRRQGGHYYDVIYERGKR
jgi:hypothetical protein